MKTQKIPFNYLIVLFLFIPYSFFGQSDRENANFKPVSLGIPFSEDWHFGNFSTNEWTISSTNWQIDHLNGNEAPSAHFHRSPLLTNYYSTLTSTVLNAENIHVGQIFLKVDMKLVDYFSTGTEYLKIEVGDSTGWNIIDSLADNGSFDWETHTYDISRFSIEKSFQVRFAAGGSNTINIQDWYLDNIELYRECEPPHNLIGFPFFLNFGGAIAYLNWDSPQSVLGNNTWKHFDSGNNSSGINFNPEKIFVAAKWEPGMLSDYVDDTIESVKFFIYDSGFVFVILKIWTGENGDNLIYSDTIDNIVPGEWTICTLNDTIIVDNSSYYWIGYELKKQEGSFMPPGIDEGPAVSGYGDNFKFDENDNWSTLSQYAINNNWNIEIYIDKEPLSDPSTLLGFNIYASDIYDTAYYLTGFVNSSQGLELYEFFNDDTCYAPYISCSPQYYKVNAMWGKDGDTCISAYARSFEIPMNDYVLIDFTENVEEKGEDHTITISPNPASFDIKIAADTKISEVTVFNLQGEKIYENTNINKTLLLLNVSEFKKGIYFLLIKTKNGFVSKKIVIV